MRKQLRLASTCALGLALAGPCQVLAQAPGRVPGVEAARHSPGYEQLASLFEDWRAFAAPGSVAPVGDYGASAIARQRASLPGFRRRLEAIRTTGWLQADITDYKLVQAEMNQLDFNFRVLQPWARDPTFYATVFSDLSDVPAHEGPYARPNINLYEFSYPLSRSDEQKLTRMIAALPAFLDAARVNLQGSNARDLWVYGERAFREQSERLAAFEQGTLVMRTLEGRKPATLTGVSPALLSAVRAARLASDAFAQWLVSQAPSKTGCSGVGKDNYNWYVTNVELVPYDWDQQVVLLRRELDRALASLRLEELRNRGLPPIKLIDDPAAYKTMADAKTQKFVDFLVEAGLLSVNPRFREVLAAQTSIYQAPDRRNFFAKGAALDPLPLLSHSIHWTELARSKYEPHSSPIRSAVPLTLYATRSEGFATAFEELVLHAGLYDDNPRTREIVWIMLANRAARGLASLYVQANKMDLAEAGKFHARWTPRGWSDPSSPLVGFEQLLYLRQPGYGPSYIIGKLQLDKLLADRSLAAELAGRPFVMRDFMKAFYAEGIIPFSLVEAKLSN
jgi:hypothetical protein